MDGIVAIVLWVFLGIIVITIIASTIRIVPQSRAYVVERIGAYNRTCNVGLHILIPFFDRVANKVSLKEQVVDFAPQPVITKDNVTMQIDTVVYYQITDPKLFTYGVDRPINAIENLTATTLRNIIGDLELDETLTSRDIINSRMRSILDEAAGFVVAVTGIGVGIAIHSVPAVLLMAGIGLILIALGVLATVFTGKLCIVMYPAMFRFIVKLCRPFAWATKGVVRSKGSCPHRRTPRPFISGGSGTKAPDYLERGIVSFWLM